MMDPHEDQITDPIEFNAALRALVSRARANGVAVEGGWDCRYDGEEPDVEVLITRLASQADIDGPE